jgi:flagellar assembly protein FliH
MSLAEKFLFDISFDAPSGGEVRQRGPVTPAEVAITRADLNAAVAQARVEGHAAGLAEATVQREQRVAETLATIGRELAALFAERDEARRDSEGTAIELTRTITGKLFPALVRQGALTEIDAVVAQCVREAIAEPRLVLRIADTMFEAAQERMAPLATGLGFPGKLIILVDDQLGPSDCRVEWADGGAERDTARTWREIEAALDRAVTALAHSDNPAPHTARTATEEIVT